MSVSCLLVVTMVLGIPPHTLSESETAPTVEGVRKTIERSLPFIKKQGAAWIKNRKCVSCHHSAFLIWSHDAARERDFSVDDTKLNEWVDWSLSKSLSKRDDGKKVGANNLEGLSQLILAQGSVPDDVTRQDSYKEFINLILAGQQPDGSWKPGGQLPTQKRSVPETTAVFTMWTQLALAKFEKNDDRISESRRKTLSWLDKAKAGTTNEWLLVRMLTEHQFGEKEKADSLLAQIIERQNSDGGWSWDMEKPSDALATGQSLYALKAAGIKSDHQAIASAWKFLISTQREDGSWGVKSTKKSKQAEAIPTSVFWGTAWATIGLAKTLPE